MRIWFLPGCMVILGLLSVLLLKSVAPSLAVAQLTFFVLGSIVFLIASQLPYEFIERWRWIGYAILCFLLMVPLLFHSLTRGVAGWIVVGNLFSIQPSQLAIPVVTLIAGNWLTQLSLKKWQSVALIVATLALPGLLILVEPDFGVFMIYTASLGSLLFVSKIPLKFIGAMLGLALISAVIGWFFLLKPYQKARITSFTDDSNQAQAANYNAQQALIAVGSGEITGRGLGQGVQSHLRFLPERQTDFIFASLAEELGFVGTAVVIGLYFALTIFCLLIAYQAKSLPEQLFCISAGIMILAQSGVNMGMNMGLLPITGITLPLLSYGGSSIIGICLVLGIVNGIARRSQRYSYLHLT